MMPQETHTRRVVSASDVPPRLRKKIEAQETNTRCSRSVFIGALLVINIGGGIAVAILYHIMNYISTTLGSILYVIGCIIIAIFNIGILAYRCHDLNRSGWWLLIGFIPVLNVLFFIYLLFAKGTEGYNDYGAPD